MDVGCQWSKIIATFIVIKILEQEEGLKYCCDFEDRFYAVVGVLGGMVKKLAENPSIRPLTLIIKCFVVLTEMPRACCALKRCLPSMLRDATFSNIINYVAAHPETRMPFVNAKIPVYLYPFLDCKGYEKPFETLRVSSLGVIGVLVVKVYVSVFGDERGKEIAISGLKSKAKYVRSELGKRMKLRLTPEIRFMEDDSIERGSRVIAILDKLKTEKSIAEIKVDQYEPSNLPQDDGDWERDDPDDEGIIYVK
ncbi:hypothetical protein U1Q18_034776 [Sarracenia purpurea var. burkii]